MPATIIGIAVIVERRVEEKLSDRRDHMKNRRTKRKNFSDFPQTAFQCTD